MIRSAAQKAIEDLSSYSAAQNEGVTEDSAALEFRERHAGALVYDHDAGSWYRWDASHWRREKTGLAFDCARTLARELADKQGKKAKGNLNRTSFARGVEKFCQCDRAFATTSEQWDPDPYLLGTPEGTVDLRTGLIRKADPNDRITKITAIAPADHADCPLWLKFMDETTGGDDQLVRFEQQFCGYSLTGSVKEHALFFGFGPGGNGKGVFVNTVTGIMGTYATTAAMDTFTASYVDKHPTEIAMLHGARLVTASETEEGRTWAENRIKQITGGDPITARYMRQDFFTFQPTFKLLLVGNHKPHLRNVDEAAKRRFNIVPFTCTPPVPDPDLAEKLRQEWPAILRWTIEGCLDWQAYGLLRPKSVTDATADYFASQDLIGQFLEEECQCDPGNEYKIATAGELFARWADFAKRAGEQPGSSFGQNLERRGFHRKREPGARTYLGIRLKPSTKNWSEGSYG